MKQHERTRLAETLARTVGEYIGDVFRTGIAHEQKHDGSIVTEADREAEHRIRDGIREAFPEDAIVGEEHENETGTSGITWYVDPIDGTRNFANGLPIFSVSIGYREDGNGHGGCAIALPISGDLFVAESGRGAYRNGERLKILDTWNDERPRFLIDHMMNQPLIEKIFAMRPQPSIRILGSVVASFTLVASGVFEGHLALGMNSWDHAAGVLLVEEAGGKTLFLSEESQRYTGKSSMVTAGPAHVESFRDFVKDLAES